MMWWNSSQLMLLLLACLLGCEIIEGFSVQSRSLWTRHNSVSGSKALSLRDPMLKQNEYRICDALVKKRFQLNLSEIQNDVNVPEYRDESSESIFSIISSIFNAAFLVAGTTIGGGFLALPTVVAPIGFYPAACTLVGVWLYFLAQSFVLVECIVRARKGQQYSILGDNYNKEESENILEEDPGITAVARLVLGERFELLVGILLTILIEATLVSQISRAGMLFQNNYQVGCWLSALSISLVVFGPKSGLAFATKANSVLTTLFIISCITVFGIGSRAADWTRLASIGGSINVSSITSAIPTFLQLLVYGEIVSTVCRLLKYKINRIHGAIFVGSFMTLCLQIGWSALGISLVAPASGVIDPINVLLGQSGPVRVPLFCLAITAILTTILGSYLALESTYKDVITQRKTSKDVHVYPSLLKRMKVASIVTIPASIIASTSPSIFLRAIDFAGSYPVLLLWGVIPPILTMMQRSRDFEKMGKEVDSIEYQKLQNTSGPSLWLKALTAISAGSVIGKLFGLL